MTRPLLALARLTYNELSRQPAHGVVVLAALLAQALSPALAMFGFEQQDALMKELSLSTVLLAGVVLVAVAASTLLEKEIDAKAALSVLSKPVSRGAFLLGKFGGLVGVLLAAVFLWTVALLLAARQGPRGSIHDPWDWPVIVCGTGALVVAAALSLYLAWRRRRHLGQVAVHVTIVAVTVALGIAAFFDRSWHLQAPGGGFDPLLLQAGYLAALGVIVLAAVALLLSVLAGRGASPGVIVVFAAGLWLGGHPSMTFAWLPSMEVFWVGEALYRADSLVSAGYLLKATLYAATYSSVCLLIGSVVLNRREIG